MQKELEKAEETFSGKIRKEYNSRLQSIIDKHKNHYHIYFFNMTLANPDHHLSINYFTEDINSFYNHLQQRIFKKRDLKKPPQHLRPILLLFYDLEGSKGNGSYSRYQMGESTNGQFRNLHAHGLLFIHPDTQKNFESINLTAYSHYQVHVQKFDFTRTVSNIRYLTKLVEQNHLQDLDFVGCYVCKSATRKHCDYNNLVETVTINV